MNGFFGSSSGYDPSIQVGGTLNLNSADRDPWQQRCAGKSGHLGDDGGHLIASSLGGQAEIG